jgi:hypothetical protein
MYIDNTADLVFHLYRLKHPALVEWNCSYCAGLSAVGKNCIKFFLGIQTSVVPSAQFVTSVLVTFVCVCVSVSQSEDMVKWTFRAVLTYIWVTEVLISAVLSLGRAWDPTSLLSSEVWYCLEYEVIAKVENVWSYISTSVHLHGMRLSDTRS